MEGGRGRRGVGGVSEVMKGGRGRRGVGGVSEVVEGGRGRRGVGGISEVVEGGRGRRGVGGVSEVVEGGRGQRGVGGVSEVMMDVSQLSGGWVVCWSWWGSLGRVLKPHPSVCCDFPRKKAAGTGSLLTHFICLALGLLTMKQMEKNCIISRVERLSAGYRNMLPGVSACFLRPRAIVIREAWPP